MEERRNKPGQSKFPLWVSTSAAEWFFLGVGMILALALIAEVVGPWLVQLRSSIGVG